MKPLQVDLPYPSTDSLTQDVRSGYIISYAYATARGELNAILQYVYHHHFFESIEQEYADTLMSIAVCEMMHLNILGSAMLKLGVNPRYVERPNTDCFFNTSSVSQATMPQKMLMDDIQGEMTAILDYQKMLLVLKNEQVAALVQRIILDEQLHLETLKNMLKKYAK